MVTGNWEAQDLQGSENTLCATIIVNIFVKTHRIHITKRES